MPGKSFLAPHVFALVGHPLHLEVPERVYRWLAERAKASGESLEAFAARWLTSTVEEAPEDPLEPFIGAFESSAPDWADAHDRHFGESLRRKTEPEKGNNPDA